MNKFVAFFVLSLLFSSAAFAQSKASIKGIITDSLSGAPLEHATVAVINSKDTTLISYTISQKDGGFKLTGIPTNRDTKLIISFMGYSTRRIKLAVKPGEIKDLGELLIAAKTLNEVVVRAERSPIVMKKDTIEFNTETFKTRPNAVVEDLLRLLPGVQVNYDGTIFVNGKEISKLLIDGKRFFGDDPRVATKNLDADMLDKIQVYDDRENDPDHKLSDMEVGKIINLKMKSKIKKSTMGKIYAGAGSRGRYEAGGILSNFRDTLQISFIGLANNLNKTGFSSSELYTMGGFDRSGGTQTWDGTFGSPGRGGIESVTSGGVNINNNYGVKLKLNLNYFYTNTIRNTDSKSFAQQTISKTVINSTSLYNSRRDEQKHAISGLVEWIPDTIKRIRYEPTLSLSPQKNISDNNANSFNTQLPKITSTLSNSSSDIVNNAFSHTFMFYHKLGKKGRSITINHSISLTKAGSEDLNYYNLTSYVSAVKSQIIDRSTDNNSLNNSADLLITYNQPISSKLTGEFFFSSRYLNTLNKGLTYDKDPVSGSYDLLSFTLSKNLTRYLFVQNLKPQFSYQLNQKTSIRLGVGIENQYVKNEFNISTAKNIEKKYYVFLPAFSMSGKGYSINYSESLDQPSIDQMQPIVRVYSQLYKTTGNPNLEAGRSHNFSFNYYNYNYDKQLNTNFNTGITLTNNTVIAITTIDSVGARTATYVNRNNAISAYFSGNIGKQFKKSQKWQIGVSTNFNGNFNRRAFFLNTDEGLQSTYNLNALQNINFNYNSTISFNTNYNLQAALTKYKNVNFASVSTLKHTVGTDVSIRWPNRVIFDARYGYSFNPEATQGFPKSSNIVNLAVTLLMLKKDRAQLKLSVYDLLDQNISVTRTANNNAITTTEQQILKRYFLINYQYKLSVYKSK
jgi:hypothetical protein